MKLLALTAVPLLLSACASGPWPAPSTAVLSELEAYILVPSEVHIYQDGFGTLLFADAIVSDESTGLPMDGIEVEVMTNWSGVYVVPQSAIKLVDYPSAPEDVLNGSAAPAEYCDVDPADGLIDANADEWCSWWWDTETSQFYQFGGDYAMTNDDFQPTYMASGTDNRGICRFYLFVDSLPYSEESGEFSSTSFWVSIGVDAVVGEITVEL